MDLGPYQFIKKLADTVVGPLLLCDDRKSKRRLLVWELPVVRDTRALNRLAALGRRVAEPAQPTSGSSDPLVQLPDGRHLWARPVPSGQSLSEVLASSVGKRCTDGLAIVAALADQLARSHGQGLWHLALHPALVYVDWRSEHQGQPAVRVVGTGLAAVLHMLRPVEASAALCYLPPEQRSDATEQPIDGAADIYALGMILIQVLLGVVFDPSRSNQRIGEYLSELTNQNFSGELLRLLRKMLAQRPVERPSIREVAQTLRSVAEEEHDDATVLQSRLHPDEVPQPALVPTQQVSAADGKVGMLCGNFRVLRKLGEGGMGVVYEAEHRQIGKRAAVKLMHAEFAENAEFAARFLNEARAVNIIRHPSLVEIFEYGQLPDGTLFIVMEFLEGQTLFDRFVKSGQPGPLLPSLQIAHQVAQALAAAHDKNIVHRDLKPENIMLINDPLHPGELRVKVLDFGIAKLARRSAPSADDRTRVGAYMGTDQAFSFCRRDRLSGSARYLCWQKVELAGCCIIACGLCDSGAYGIT